MGVRTGDPRSPSLAGRPYDIETHAPYGRPAVAPPAVASILRSPVSASASSQVAADETELVAARSQFASALDSCNVASDPGASGGIPGRFMVTGNVDLVPDEALIGRRRHMQLRYDS